ncbi:glycoside hydrolase [Armillaria novae-zelandiae]|uniref:Glycoside hydrolase n=1 Tax=Armillaria novae-zelandiae TaxID=153914 RepID=A0AA39PR34_9AGAR|nr:glycoside hydrolase [Armillaria novae-zelandiae]
MAGAWDEAYEWTTLTDDERSDIKSQYAAAGVKLLVFVFGSSDVPTISGADPIATADTMAAWITQYKLDGIDVDYEDFAAIDAVTEKLKCVHSSSHISRNLSSSAIHISLHTLRLRHGSLPRTSGGGGYLKVHEMVGDMIDRYNVQFYNRKTLNLHGLLNMSYETWNGTALFQIADNGVDLSKLVIGKPATASDASNGYMDPDTLATCLGTAKDRGWDGGAMVWQYPHGDESWIASVRDKS